MRLPLSKIIDFAMKQPNKVDKAYRNFFGDLPTSQLKAAWEELFLEWLIFDFKPKDKVVFFNQYVLLNPDNFGNKKIAQLEQIAQTHFYSQFEIQRLQPGQWLEIEDIFSGKTCKVYDKKGSQSIPKNGTVAGRLAQVDHKWYLIGANPVYFPITYTERMKKIMHQNKPPYYSPKDIIDLLRFQEERKDQKAISPPTKKQIKAKQKTLKKRYEKMIKQYQGALTFKQLAQEIYQENRVNVLDFWKSLEKKGLPMTAIVENIQLLQDMWNYLPHKSLNDKSPAEMFQELKNNSQ